MPVIPQLKEQSALTPKFAPVQPARHFCIDLETGDADKADIELAQQYVKPWANTKDEAKQKVQMEEKRAKIAEKSALLDAAPISCATIITESSRAIFYHRDDPWPKKMKEVKDLKGWDGEMHFLRDEREMLLSIRDWMDRRAIPDSILIGHNIYGFDLPKLRGAYVRDRLIIPKVLQPEARDAGVEVYDVMQKFLRFFTTEKNGERYISLEEVSARLGLPPHKQYASGEDMPFLAKQGRVREVLTYNFLDSLSSYTSFLVMTGQYKDQLE